MTRARTLSLLGNENNFTVTGSNNVGIGSTLPDAKLDVGGDIVVGTAITIGSVSGIISATDFYVDGISITGAAGTWATFTTGGEGGISTTKKVKIENGLEVTGISTFSGALTVGGVLTYEDVTNVDSLGIITARSYVSIADSIVHTGDTDTSIRFPAADTFTVETAGSERLRVNSGGIEVTGGIYAPTGISTFSNVVVGGATTEMVITGDLRVTGIITTGTGTVTIDGPNNRIGIGTASPRTTLDLSQETGGIALPQGTTAQRPTGNNPYIRWNTTNSALEFYNGTDWVEIISDYFPSGSTILG